MYNNLKIKCWYWNTIVDNNKPIINDNKNIEFYSFDRNDCMKYSMKYNIQYYCEQDIKCRVKDIDLYFIGMNKNRKEIINTIKEEAIKQNINCDFNVIDDLKDFIPYYKIKEKISCSKAILDIVKDSQVGQSLRPLESLFFETKLVTNNKEALIENPEDYAMLEEKSSNKNENLEKEKNMIEENMNHIPRID